MMIENREDIFEVLSPTPQAQEAEVNRLLDERRRPASSELVKRLKQLKRQNKLRRILRFLRLPKMQPQALSEEGKIRLRELFNVKDGVAQGYPVEFPPYDLPTIKD